MKLLGKKGWAEAEPMPHMNLITSDDPRKFIEQVNQFRAAYEHEDYESFKIEYSVTPVPGANRTQDRVFFAAMATWWE